MGIKILVNMRFKRLFVDEMALNIANHKN